MRQAALGKFNHLITTKETYPDMTMAETDAIQLDGDAIADIAQAALFDGEDIERSSPVFLPGFEGLGRMAGNPVYDDEAVIQQAINYYREKGFPYRALPMHVMMQQINQLAQTDSDNLTGTVVGYSVADTYHPHRFAAAATDKRSPLDSFNSDKYLRMTIEKTLAHGAVGEEFLGMMALVAGTQACSNFRPGFALSYYRRFGFPGWTVLDTSTGYGGRLVGFLATNSRGSYIGIDPNVPTHEGNVRMMHDLGISKGYRALLLNMPAEDVQVDNAAAQEGRVSYVAFQDEEHYDHYERLSKLREVADFAFTSPPYFAKERYSFDDTQSWVRYGESAELWRDKFLYPMLRLQFDVLKPGAYSCINIADVKIKNVTAPLSDWTVEAAIAAGFEVKGRDNYKLQRRMGKGAANGTVAFEPVHIFQKPERKVQIVNEGPVDLAALADYHRTGDGHGNPAPDCQCEREGCTHKYAKHDDESPDMPCLKCDCGGFFIKGVSDEPLPPATLEMPLYHAPFPPDGADICGECPHMYAHHDEDEADTPCLKKQCGCGRWTAPKCPSCSARDGERHREGCASVESQPQPEAASAPAPKATSNTLPGVVDEQGEDWAAAAQAAQKLRKWKCAVDDCIREDVHTPGDACQRGRGAAVAGQADMPGMPIAPPIERKSASPKATVAPTQRPATPGSAYGAPTEHHAERKEDAPDRPLSVQCRGCGAARGVWCLKEAP